jgi:putative ABC transport system ATP-binding protein
MIAMFRNALKRMLRSGPDTFSAAVGTLSLGAGSAIASNLTTRTGRNQESANAASPLTPTVIEMRSITKTYEMGGHAVHALASVDVEIARGDFVAIMGTSGSGKSTLMNIIGCLDIPTRGRFFLDGVDIAALDEEQLATARNRKIGFIFQSFNLIPRTSALDNVELPLAYAGMKPKPRRQRAIEALEIVGLADRMDHLPSELSGGQQQRVAVARAIATNPALLLADEPTGNLDSTSTMEVLDVFVGLNDRGRTVVLITHEDEVAARAKRIIRLKDGKIVEDHRIRGLHERELPTKGIPLPENHSTFQELDAVPMMPVTQAEGRS